MRLYLFRHGPAGDKRAWHGIDSERPLTEDGAATTALVARRLAALGLEPMMIVTSPYARCAQTAELLSQALDGPEPRLDDRLAPGFSVADLFAVLEEAAVEESVLVGHDPDFSVIIEALTGARVHMRKAGVARIELPKAGDGTGLLTWLATPRLLR